MPNKNDPKLASAMRGELEVMGDGVSDKDRQKITRLKALLPIIESGKATAKQRADARVLTHASKLHY